MRILAISGSLRAGSYNTALARAAADVAPDGVEIEVFDGLRTRPALRRDLDQEGTRSRPCGATRRIEGADAVLLVTPEYNGSTRASSRTRSTGPRAAPDAAALRGKTVAMAGASTGEYGALWAQQDLRRVLGIAGARVVKATSRRPRARKSFDESGTLASPLVAERLRNHLAALVNEASPVAIAA